MTNPSSQSRNGELIAKLQKHISPDRDALLMEVGKISEVMPEKMAKWFVMVDDLLRECLTALQSAAHSEIVPNEAAHYLKGLMDARSIVRGYCEQGPWADDHSPSVRAGDERAAQIHKALEAAIESTRNACRQEVEPK